MRGSPGAARVPPLEDVAVISPAIAEQVERLLAEGKLSQRRIALRLGISRGSVDAIAGGRWAGPARGSEDDEELPAGPAVRCPGCGGLVYPPCRLCRVRALQRRERARAALRRRFQRPPASPPRPAGCAGQEGVPGDHTDCSAARFSSMNRR